MSNDLYKRIQAQNQGNGGASATPTPTHFDMISAMIGGSKITPAQVALVEQVLTRTDDGGLMFDDVKLSPVGLIIPPDGIEQSTGERLLDFLLKMDGSIGWMIGDILAYGDNKKWGEFYKGAVEKYDRTYNTLTGYVYVASNVQFWVRTQNLSFAHHKLVAPMDEVGQQMWLQYAERNKWSRTTMAGYLAPMRNWSADDQRAWLEVVERDKLTPEKLANEIAVAAGGKKREKPAGKFKDQLTKAAYLTNVIKRYGVELDGAESDTIKHAVKAAREVLAMASAIIEKHGGGK